MTKKNFNVGMEDACRVAGSVTERMTVGTLPMNPRRSVVRRKLVTEKLFGGKQN